MMHYLTLPCIFVFGFFNSKTVGVSVFGGVGERTREGNDLYEEIAFHYPNSFIAKQKNMEKYKSRSENKKLN